MILRAILVSGTAALLVVACEQKAASPTSAAAATIPATLIGKGFFKSVSVTLPESDRVFPDGPGHEAITNNCLSCHSAGMILNQPKLSQQVWTEEVTKMRNVYKAPVAEGDVPAIVAYLAALKPAT